MDNYKNGSMAEAVDRLGVWAKCMILENHCDFVLVTFPPWSAEWDRKIENPDEIRPTTEEVLMPRNVQHSMVSDALHFILL